MDMLDKLSGIEDPELQALLTHAVRYALTHNLIASQALAMKDNPQANQAAAIHKETAAVLNALVNYSLKDVADSEEVPAPSKRRKKIDA